MTAATDLDSLSQSVQIEEVFRGPPPFAHGGYVAGVLSKHVGQVMRIVLRAPTPRQKNLDILRTADGVTLNDGEQVLIEAFAASKQDLPEVPEAVLSCSVETAKTAGARFPKLRAGQHPNCYCCGDTVDGVALHVGLGPRDDAPAGWLAGMWTPPEWIVEPDGSIDAAHLWGAIDCPGWYVWRAKEQDFPVCFLGTMTGEVISAPKADEPLMICAWPIEGGTGRKRFTGIAALDKTGAVIARGKHIWVTMK